MGRVPWALILAFMGIAQPYLAWGDGKIFPAVGFVRTETPSQRALIHWADGVETLAIETTVRSDATRLAWILPLPSRPASIRPADPGLFPTLQNIFQIKVETRQSWGWIGGLMASGIVLLTRWRLQGKISITFVHVLVAITTVILLPSFLLPSLAKAKGGDEAGQRRTDDSSVRVLSEGRAGVFDVTTLTATRPEDLLEWLRQHGFGTPEGLLPIVRDYLERRWVFVAARVENAKPGALASLHPIVFRFPTKTPVYPMRLTGLGSDSLDCDLYVFGPNRAEARGWQVRYCGIPDFTPRTTYEKGPYPLRIRNAELASLVGGSAVATKLSARLTPGDFTEDVELGWHPFQAVGQIVYTRRVALWSAATKSSWVLALGVLIGSWRARRRGVAGAWLTPMDRAGAVIGLGLGTIVALAIPTVPEEKVEKVLRGHFWSARHNLLDVLVDAMDLPAVQAALTDVGRRDDSNALAKARAAIAGLLGKNASKLDPSNRRGDFINIFTGERVRLESSPGNINVEVSSQGLELVWYDFDGAAAFRHTIPR